MVLDHGKVVGGVIRAFRVKQVNEEKMRIEDLRGDGGG